MDYWESGMHLALGTDLFDSFIRYQRRLIDEYRRLADEFGFLTIDARCSIDDVQTDLRTHITEYLQKVTNHHAESDVQAGAPPSSRKD
jgi:dTMP kinase